MRGRSERLKRINEADAGTPIWVHLRKANPCTSRNIVKNKKAAEKALDKIQKDLKVDVIGFGKKLKDDWDHQFRGMHVEVKVNLQIQEFGTKGTKN